METRRKFESTRRHDLTPFCWISLAIMLNVGGGCAPERGSSYRSYDACIVATVKNGSSPPLRAAAQDACVRRFARAPTRSEAQLLQSEVSVTFDADNQHTASDTLDNAIQALSSPGDVLRATLNNTSNDLSIRRVKVFVDFYDGPPDGAAGFAGRRLLSSLNWVMDTDTGPGQSDELRGAFAGGAAPSRFYAGRSQILEVLPHTGAA